MNGRTAAVTKKTGRSNRPVTFPSLLTWGHQMVTLVAYDEVMIRNLVTILMQDEGYFVLSASDGQEALELSRAYPGAIDLLITDVKMPRLTCTDLCSRLLEERPGIKVVVMLGTDMNGIVRPGIDSPLLPEPFDGETLKAKIRVILAAPPQPAPYVYMVFLGRPPLESDQKLLSAPQPEPMPHPSTLGHTALFRKASQHYLLIA
jgi:CheY-like chemotaxis protein